VSNQFRRRSAWYRKPERPHRRFHAKVIAESSLLVVSRPLASTTKTTRVIEAVRTSVQRARIEAENSQTVSGVRPPMQVGPWSHPLSGSASNPSRETQSGKTHSGHYQRRRFWRGDKVVSPTVANPA